MIDKFLIVFGVVMFVGTALYDGVLSWLLNGNPHKVILDSAMRILYVISIALCAAGMVLYHYFGGV